MKEHAKKFKDDPVLRSGANQICQNSYVDDILVLANEESQLENDVENVNHILELANLPTHKYVSNSAKTLEKFPKEKLSEKDRVSILGTIWTPESDLITFNFVKSPLTQQETDVKNQSITKRNLLSLLAKIFDAMGILSAYTILAKVTLQKTWERKIPWDEPLKDDLLQEAQAFLSEASYLENLQLNIYLI